MGRASGDCGDKPPRMESGSETGSLGVDNSVALTLYWLMVGVRWCWWWDGWLGCWFSLFLLGDWRGVLAGSGGLSELWLDAECCGVWMGVLVTTTEIGLTGVYSDVLHGGSSCLWTLQVSNMVG